MPSDDIMVPVDPALIQQLLQDPNTAAALAAGQPTEFNNMYHLKIQPDIADHISGFQSAVSSSVSTDTVSEETDADEIYTVSDNMTVKVSKFDRKEYEDIEKAINMHLSEGSLVCSCSDNEINIEDCISVEDNVITIKQGGIYVISGTMRKGSIKVDGPDNKKVRIILDNAFIASDLTAPLNIVKADKASVIAKEGTENYLIKTGTYDNGSDKPNACLFSRCDLTLGGSGSLTVKTECGNGIGTKDDLKIMNGNIYVQSVKNGLKGNDSVSIFGGTIRVRAGKDAVKSDKEDKEGKGFIFINDGNMAFIAGDDILESPLALVVRGGQMNDYFGGKEFNCNGYTEVNKADQ
ncbi:MAG: carbohydrate-binding domain-containing protein [Lachnospiraceae bacterium]|nr:carbohydrate-binding domain-containing protein [Lachnospiraceae bacterium]